MTSPHEPTRPKIDTADLVEMARTDRDGRREVLAAGAGPVVDEQHRLPTTPG
jgi:hypothetical protein